MSKTYNITALELGPMENFIHLIQDSESKRTAIVDPAWDVPSILDTAKRCNMDITDILIPHSHHDHINGIEGVLEQTDAQLHILKAELDFWGQQLPKPAIHHGGDHIKLGKTDIQILHTPGHTPGSACYLLDDDILTGDTLFVYGCGKCSLAGGDPEVMYHTLQKMAAELPSNTEIFPGHNYAIRPRSSMAEQISGNPFLHLKNLPDFIHYRMDIHDHVREDPYGPETPEATQACLHDH